MITFKMILRIITSPVVFLALFVGLTIIPIGPLSLLAGLVSLILPESDMELDETFSWFVLPYVSAKQWILEGTITD